MTIYFRNPLFFSFFLLRLCFSLEKVLEEVTPRLPTRPTTEVNAYCPFTSVQWQERLSNVQTYVLRDPSRASILPSFRRVDGVSDDRKSTRKCKGKFFGKIRNKTLNRERHLLSPQPSLTEIPSRRDRHWSPILTTVTRKPQLTRPAPLSDPKVVRR